MWIVRSQGLLAIGAAAALAGAMAGGQVACSSSSPGGSGSSSGSGSGSTSGSSSGFGEGGGGTPAIVITSPMNGATVTPADTNSVFVTFTLASFTLADPTVSGACDPKSDNCGHIHIYVDDNACTPDGAAYNNVDATASPAQALLSNCPAVAGMHTIRLELHHQDHSPVIVGDASSAVSASVMVTVSAGADASSG